MIIVDELPQQLGGLFGHAKAVGQTGPSYLATNNRCEISILTVMAYLQRDIDEFLAPVAFGIAPELAENRPQLQRAAVNVIGPRSPGGFCKKQLGSS